MYATQAVNFLDQRPVSLQVRGVEWNFAVSAVTRRGCDLFLLVRLQGPADCALTVRLGERIVAGVTARQVLVAACEWLLSRDGATQGYVDLVGAERVESIRSVGLS